MSVLRLVLINIVLALFLNITVGKLGQITLGHAGFMSIGAYTAALFTKAGIIPGLGDYLVGMILEGSLSRCIIYRNLTPWILNTLDKSSY